MINKTDHVKADLGALLAKTLENALAHRIEKEFPLFGGPRICKLCAEMILEVVHGHIRSKIQADNSSWPDIMDGG